MKLHLPKGLRRAIMSCTALPTALTTCASASLLFTTTTLNQAFAADVSITATEDGTWGTVTIGDEDVSQIMGSNFANGTDSITLNGGSGTITVLEDITLGTTNKACQDNVSRLPQMKLATLLSQELL